MAITAKRHEAAEVIEHALRRSGRSQGWLGAEVARIEDRHNPYGQASVSEWIAKIDTQLPSRIFAIERALGFRPGTVSRLLGYVPADTKPARSVTDAVHADERLDEDGRRAVLAVYQTFRR